MTSLRLDMAQPSRNAPFRAPNYSDEVTLVMAYFNIGSFIKGSKSNTYTADLYKKWMRIFSKISNPVVAYVDDNKYYEYFKHLRGSANLLNKTKIFKLERGDMWAFSLLPKIKKIFSNPKYPKFPPNTVVPEYSCAMHAKYELMLKTVQANSFRTNYFAWIDVGLFRDLNSSQVNPFHIELPPKFDKKKIAYSQVFQRVTSAPPDVIFKTNGVWVCGCFFIGHRTQMTKWTNYYMNYTVKSLDKGLMNTDQQVLYAMVNDKSYHLNTTVQTYGTDGNWFQLGYLCKVPDDKNDSNSL